MAFHLSIDVCMCLLMCVLVCVLVCVCVCVTESAYGVCVCELQERKFL